MTWLFEIIGQNYFYIGIIIALAVWIFSIADAVRTGQPDIDIAEGVFMSVVIGVFWGFAVVLVGGEMIILLINKELNKQAKANRK